MTAVSAANLKVLNALPGDAWSDAYLASAPGHDKLVLRMLKAEAAADPQRVERFLTGARALASLRHGAVVSVHDAGKTRDGKIYVLTDHVEGDTLAMRSQLPVEQVVDVGVPLADALGAAHKLGLVHGALSPARVVLTHSGPRLDFSLAPLLREDSADAAGDIRTLAAMLQAQVAPGDDKEPFDSSMRRALAGVPDARVLRDRLVNFKDTKRTATGEVQRTALSKVKPPPAPEDEAVVESVQIEDPDLTGKTIGNYVCEKVLGEGAMGRVYLARHTRIGRQAAIKVLKAEHASSRELVTRFIQEATAVNAIKNDHIVEIYDFGEEMLPDGSSRVYCVMELLEGIALSDEMWKAPLKIERAVRITQQMARALGAAHAVGIVHRDIKPDNIFLSVKKSSSPAMKLDDAFDDYVKLLDFGVAKLLKQIGDLPRAATSVGIVIGTPEYMAPEQALGLGTDFRVDVYAVGLVLYEMLTGAQPFQADTFGKLVVEITSRTPPPLPQKSHGGQMIPRSLADVVMRCLAKKPEERWGSTEELAQALEPFSGRPQAEDAAPIEGDSAAIAAMKPRPARMLLIAAALVALVGGGGYWALRPYDAPAPPPQPEAPRPPEQIVLEIESNPSGARVTRADTSELIGTTPLEVKLDKKDGTVTLKFEHEGNQTLERVVSLSRNNSLTVDLAPAPAAVPEKPEKPEREPAPKPKANVKKKAAASPSGHDSLADPSDK